MRVRPGRLARTSAGRWAGAGLAVTLVLLTAAAVFGSWRQAAIVGATAEAAARMEAFQRTRYLAATEMVTLQGTVLEPNGEERDSAGRISRELNHALYALADIDEQNHAALTGLAERQQDIQPSIGRYFQLLDQGDQTGALAVLEQEIEPAAAAIRFELSVRAAALASQYEAQLARARKESRLLQAGTTALFLVGLAVLAVLGLSGRARRRLVESIAAQDPLTGLPNRTAFYARLDLAARAATAEGRQPTVLMLDLDGFKEVNDALGHHMGDLLLVEVAHRLRASVRGDDTVARLGGDEFALLLAGAEPGVGEQTADRIVTALSHPFLLEDISLDIEASIGIATLTPGQEVATIVRQADTAMYVAKEHRLGHTRFDPLQTPDTAARHTLLGAMRRALDSNEIVLHYQPKMSVDSGQLLGVEALARWQHPDRGLLGPAEFIPVLENTSLVHRFTTHVLGLALGQVRTWLDRGSRIPVAINVSTRCLLDEEFPNTIAQALVVAGVPGELLCIEITENTVMANPERAIDVLSRIRGLGVRTAIDDFGTGYSSMAYLKILPIDEIKVDRSFVRDMATDHSNHVLVESTVDLGHNLGLAVVAEGVEDDPTLAALHGLGCDIAQGYLFARPLSPADFDAWLVDVPAGVSAPATHR